MNLANKLTIFRVILVPLMVIIPFFNIEGEILNIPVEFWIIDLIFIIASITDKLDGYIARSRNQITTFGKFLDPIADKILVISAMLILVEKGYLPAWIPAIVITREFIVSGYRLVASQKDGTVIVASVWGKLKTVTQMIAIILAFININGTNSFGKCFTGNLQGVELIINVLTTLCMIVSVIATIFSGYDYVKKRKRLIKLREVIRMLDKKQAKKRIDELIKETQYHAKKYYDDDKPEISDFEYDMLMNELKNLEKQFPEFIREDSLTQKVGGTVKKGFKKVEHEVPLQSLQDIFDFDELRAFDNRIKKEAEDSHKELKYVVETKIDGLSVALKYINGEFVEGATRGNGQIGEDVTENLKTIKTIPQVLKEKINITVRGEVFISKDDFEKLNEEQEILEAPLFANARNAAAGSLRQLDSKITKNRPLDIYIFNVQKIEGKEFNSHYEELKYLEKIGFNVNPVKIPCDNLKQVIDAINKIGDEREKLTFGIDGAVIKVDDLELREIIGTTFKTPKWAIAYKYPPEKKETILKDITCQVGRTGQITPMAILEPVKVAGSTISKTTLHNEDYIKEKDLKIGDHVIVQKAGDVIPEVVEVVKEKRDGTEIEFKMPDVCPVCGAPAIREDGESATRCIGIECPARRLRNLVHFASKAGMDIDGLGYSIIEQLVEKNLIKEIADIYYLEEEQIQTLKKNGKKFASNLKHAIDISKENSLDKLISALGIRHVGTKTAKTLARKYKTLDNLKNASLESLTLTEDVGDIMAESIYDFFRQEQTEDLIKKLRIANVNFGSNEESIIDNRFEGKVFVLTGSLEKYTREQASEIIEKYGGKTASSVSKKTSYVLAGESSGSKLTRAMSLGVEILTEEQFDNMIK